MENLVIKANCVQANKNKNGSVLQFAIIDPNTPGTQPGQQVARTAVSIIVPDNKAANGFDTDKVYTITISE